VKNMITPTWHREYFLERARSKRACAKDIVRVYGGRHDDRVARIKCLEAEILLREAKYLEDASTSEDEKNTVERMPSTDGGGICTAADMCWTARGAHTLASLLLVRMFAREGVREGLNLKQLRP
jgi:hypothetical protein